MSPLKNTAWQLVSFDGKPVLSNAPIDLLFRERSFEGNTSVNKIFGHYKTAKEHIFLDKIGSTMKASTDPIIMEQERLYMAILIKAKSYKLRDNHLEIITDDNKILLFAPLIT